MFADQDRPRLARGVRLRYDRIRDAQLLLRPEGAVELNPSAAAVLQLCDGERTLQTIIADLSAQYDGADVGADVRELLGDLERVGVVIHADR
jgi:pyrroloquinoline quinone biosynthesis protein D